MNIVYACNDYYIPQTGISIISVCENNKDLDEIVFYFLSDNVSELNISILKDIVSSYNRTLKVFLFKEIAYDLNISEIGRHIATIYAKAFFSRIEGLNKAIYLDSDIIVVGSLEKLWETELDEYYIGAVQTFSKSKSKLGLPEETPFFNDGMVLVNVEYCRKNNMIDKIKNVIAEYNGAPPVLSEGALNVVCRGKIKYLSLRYNLMSGILYFYRLNKRYLFSRLNVYSTQDISESCENPVCIHYLSGFYNRPWFRPCNHPYKYQYFKYQKISPWNNSVPELRSLPLRIRIIDMGFRLFGLSFMEFIKKRK